MASIAVQTLTDNVLEDVEFLKCNILEIISDETCSVLRGPDDMARVNITDNTSMCMLGCHIFHTQPLYIGGTYS